MEWNDLIYCPLIGYFIIIITVLYSISLNKLPTRYSLLFNSLALIAFAFTWYYMILYFERSFIQAALLQNYRLRYYSIKAWLLSTSLFHQAWLEVLDSPLKRWWSDQLCIFSAGTMTVFLYSQGPKFGTRKSWKYMLIGQIVAISFAQSLFFASLSTSTTSRMNRLESKNPSLILLLCVAISLVTVSLVPITIEAPYMQYFLPNLLIMHGTLLLPLLEPSTAIESSVSYQTLYSIIAVASAALRISNYYSLLDISTLSNPLTLLETLYSTFFGHPAQSSISSDVVLTSVIFLLYILLDARKTKSTAGLAVAIVATLLTPVLGIGCTGAIYLAYREKRNLKLD